MYGKISNTQVVICYLKSIANSKLVKLFYEGDVRARDLSEQDTHDQTVDSQVQVKLGTGVVCDNLTGRYEIV